MKITIVQQEYELVTLAGLLHDIGKLALNRVVAGRSELEDDLEHAQAGVDFLAALGAEQVSDWPRLRQWIGEHHTKAWSAENQQLGQLVSIADSYSSRERITQQKRRRDEQSRMESIFRQVQTIYPPPQIHYFGAAELTPTTAFPRQQAPSYADFNPLVERFAEGARELIQATSDLRHLLTGFTDLLARFATPVCADKGSFPFDISLFDHLSTTAAIAACQYLYHAGRNHWDDLTHDGAEKFLLIGGDLSGIQRYLYEIAQVGPGGVAKRLRARSFYLTALQQVIAFRLCTELTADLGVTLPPNCQLLNTGGRFLILAPNLPVVHERLAQIDRAVNGWLRRETHSDLACLFAAVPLCGKDFQPARQVERPASGEMPPGASSITRKIEEVYERLNLAKQRRYHNLFHTATGWQDVFVQRTGAVFYLAGDGEGEGGSCRSCGKLPAEPPFAADQEDELDADDQWFCRRCREDVALGRFLLRTAFIAYRQGISSRATPDDAFDLHFFADNPADPHQGYSVRLAAHHRALADFAPQQVEFLAIDASCFTQPEGDGAGSPAFTQRQAAARAAGLRYPVRRRYLANYVPRQPLAGDGAAQPGGRDEIVPFDELATHCGRAELRGTVEPLVGVVKMDVDQLGRLLAEGLGEATSISRVATFSRMLDLFFAGWVDTRLRRPFALDLNGQVTRDSDGAPVANHFHDMYTVYAGGDDLLLVGPWDTAVLAAQQLQQDFRRFTNANPNLTLSAAVAVIKPRYPVAKAAQQAGRLLDEHAKGEGRNRFHLFGVTAPWRNRRVALPKGLADGERQARETLAQQEEERRHTPLADLWRWAERLDDELYRYRRSRETGDSRYPVSNILLHRILRLSVLAQRVAEQRRGDISELTYMAHLAYFLGRSIRPADYAEHDPATAAHLQGLLADLMELTQFKNVHRLAQMRLPLTWALYRNRQRSTR